MPQRAATIESLPAAFAMVKAMQAQGLEGEATRGRQREKREIGGVRGGEERRGTKLRSG